MARLCNRCCQPINFGRYGRGGWRPLNPDNSFHKCPGKPSRVDSEPGRSMVGANYAPVDCACPVPPWEFCACFPDHIVDATDMVAEPRLSVLMGEAME